MGAEGWTMTGFEEDPVFQAMNLLGFSEYCPEKLDDRVDRLNADREIRQMMKNLELKIVEEKQQQIDKLEGQLKIYREEKNYVKRKLVGYINLMHREMAKFLSLILSLAKKNMEVSNVLNLGPFENEENMMEFLGLVGQLGLEFEGGFQELGKTKKLMHKVNLILAVTSQSTQSEREKDIQNTVQGRKRFENELLPNDSLEMEQIGQEIEVNKDKKQTNEVMSTQGILGLHAKDRFRSHAHLQEYFCLCGKRYRCSSSLYGHLKSFEYHSNFVCNVCSQSFQFAHRLRRHQFKCHGIDNGFKITCTRCHQEFRSRGDYQHHLKAIHGGQKRLSQAAGLASYISKIGNKAYARKNLVKKYKCTVCGIGFANLSELNLHKGTSHTVHEEMQARVHANTTSRTVQAQFRASGNAETINLIDAEPESSGNETTYFETDNLSEVQSVTAAAKQIYYEESSCGSVICLN